MNAQRVRTIVLSYGVFDGIETADARMLQAVARLGDEIIIGCATDQLCAARDLRPRLAFADRRALLGQCRWVSRVIAQDSDAQHRTDIVNYNVDVLALAAGTTGRFDHLRDIAQVVTLPQGDAPVAFARAVA